VTAVETPPPAVEQRRCPRCGSELTAEQEWCLECGAGVGTTVVAPPSWRGPAAIVGLLLAIAAAALILALVELAGDAEQVSEQPPAAPQQAAPVPTQAPVAPAPTTAPESTTIPPAPETGGTATVAEWPTGTEGWTVVLESSSTEEAAEARAQELAGQGISVGMLNSDDFGSLEPGRYVVFSGQYDSRRAADQALTGLTSQVEGAYVRRVAPE
jgi:septal ring-binding cell division protein DamX